MTSTAVRLPEPMLAVTAVRPSGETVTSWGISCSTSTTWKSDSSSRRKMSRFRRGSEVT
jgi:hypothetical protein